MTREGRLRLGQIGGGAAAEELMPAWVEHRQVEEVYLAEADRALREGLAGRWGIVKRAVSDWRELVAEESVDVVNLDLPAGEQAAVAEAALAAGKHVLMGGPAAASRAEWERLARAAERAERRVLVRSPQAAHPALNRARELVEAGEVGRLYLAQVLIVEAPGEAGAPDLAERSFEPILTLQRFLGPVRRVSASRRRGGRETPEALQVTLEQESGLSGLSLAGGVEELRPQEERRLVGTEGMLLVRDDPEDELPLVLIHGRELVPVPVRVPLYVRPWVRQRMVERLLATVLEEAEPPCSAEEAGRALAVLEALREAVRTGQRTEVG